MRPDLTEHGLNYRRDINSVFEVRSLLPILAVRRKFCVRDYLKPNVCWTYKTRRRNREHSTRLSIPINRKNTQFHIQFLTIYLWLVKIRCFHVSRHVKIPQCVSYDCYSTRAVKTESFFFNKNLLFNFVKAQFYVRFSLCTIIFKIILVFFLCVSIDYNFFCWIQSACSLNMRICCFLSKELRDRGTVIRIFVRAANRNQY